MHATAVCTFTVTDIKLAFEHLEADLRALVQRTGLRDIRWAVDLATDVMTLAIEGYLKRFDLMLYDEYERRIRARTYAVDDGGSGRGDRSGGNRWPYTPDGGLSSVITYNDDWFALPAETRAAFKDERLRLTWSPTKVDTTYADLAERGGRTYSHNAAQITRRDYA